MNSSFAQLNSKVEVIEEKVNEFEEKSRDIYQFNKDKRKMKINEQFLSDMWDNIKPSSCKEDRECDRKRENVIEKYIKKQWEIHRYRNIQTHTHTHHSHTHFPFFFFPLKGIKNKDISLAMSTHSFQILFLKCSSSLK